MNGFTKSLPLMDEQTAQTLALFAMVTAACLCLATIYASVAIQLDLHQNPQYFLATTTTIAGAVAVPVSLMAFYRENYRYLEHTTLERFATTDPLTSALNKRAFKQMVNSERRRMLRTRHTGALICFDIDAFADIQASFGSDFADQVMIESAAVAQFALRGPFDFLCRWEADNFYIFLHNVSLPQAHKIAERLSHKIAQHEVRHAGQSTFATASMGVTPIAHDFDLKTARALAGLSKDKAKSLGAGKVVASHPFNINS